MNSEINESKVGSDCHDTRYGYAAAYHHPFKCQQSVNLFFYVIKSLISPGNEIIQFIAHVLVFLAYGANCRFRALIPEQP
jgi:hypothetical protein